MSSRFSLQKPHVIASLPQPIDRTNGRYVVGEVIGGGVGTKKRKRSELAVGIDGEGLSLYDISSSKLITSYALPPQSTFTCPPASVRCRISKTTVERKTYVSTKEPQAQITLFREKITEGSAESSTATHTLTSTSTPVVYVGTISASNSWEAGGSTVDVLAVHEDGEIQCFNGESLQKRWTSPASAIVRDASKNLNEPSVEFAQLTNAHAASQGILKGRQDVFSLFPQEVSAEGFNPEILVVITKSARETSTIRTLHILSLPKRASQQTNGLQQSVDSLLTSELPPPPSTDNGHAGFSLHVSTGILQQLQNEVLTTFDLTDTLPKEQNRITATSGQSFLRLSSTSVLVSSPKSITVYNPKYQSILATVDLDSTTNPENRKRKRESMDDSSVVGEQCKFISYFPRLAVATAILGSKLIGIQVEGYQDRQGKLQTAGLLIDSIGRSAGGHMRPAFHNGTTHIDGMTTLGNYLPTAIGHDVPWANQIIQIERTFERGECDGATFDNQIAQHLGMDLRDDNGGGLVNGTSSKESANEDLAPSDVDRRWIIYALSKIFTVIVGDAGENVLSISFYPPKTFMWLITNGFMTVANIEAGLRKAGSTRSFLAGSLVDLIVNTDQDMDLLLVLVAKNYLGAAELLHAIRYLVAAVGPVADPDARQLLLTNGEDLEMTNGNTDESVTVDERYERLDAEIERDLELAEYRLGPGSGTQGHALSIALSKLYTRPSPDIVHALQTTFTTAETIGLIDLLRDELRRGGWTTKYLEDYSYFSEDEDAAQAEKDEEQQDNAITVIASLLNNCIDAIGAGGWLSGDAKLVDGDPITARELIFSMKLETSAALEAIEEAAYLKGFTSEMIRYGDAVETSLSVTDTKTDAPVILPTAGDSKMLPVGLKAEKPIPLSKVAAGGVINKRTKRDIGYLKSQKIGKYSRERIRV